MTRAQSMKQYAERIESAKEAHYNKTLFKGFPLQVDLKRGETRRRHAERQAEIDMKKDNF